MDATHAFDPRKRPAGLRMAAETLVLGLLFCSALSAAPLHAEDSNTVTIDIRGRLFVPDTVHLHQGRKTRLIIRNHDSELHAFVPSDLLAGVNMNIGGNGAPEFGDRGFKRVIIPADGQVDLRFTPERPGHYAFLCDMPGHEMRGTITVE